MLYIMTYMSSDNLYVLLIIIHKQSIHISSCHYDDLRCYRCLPQELVSATQHWLPIHSCSGFSSLGPLSGWVSEREILCPSGELDEPFNVYPPTNITWRSMEAYQRKVFFFSIAFIVFPIFQFQVVFDGFHCFIAFWCVCCGFKKICELMR